VDGFFLVNIAVETIISNHAGLGPTALNPCAGWAKTTGLFLRIFSDKYYSSCLIYSVKLRWVSSKTRAPNISLMERGGDGPTDLLTGGAVYFSQQELQAA
jgi:hypothetical protein